MQTLGEPLRIAIRVDASPVIGGGHVMRCLTLATALAKRGDDIVFVCAAGTLDVVPALAACGFAVVEGADFASAAAIETAVRLRWLDGADWLIFDSYSIDALLERALRGAARRIMVIDDLANRPHDCDVLLDQNLGRRAEDYAGLVPSSCCVLAGTGYALLRPEFAAARTAALARRESAFTRGQPVARILVSLGMTDFGGLTERVVRAVIEANTGAMIDVVLGRGAPSLAALRALAAERHDVVLHVDDADMCQLTADADLAVGAAGSTSWERCCLGLPTIMLVLADNQREVARALVAAGAAVVCDVGEIPIILRLWTGDPYSLLPITNKAASITTGCGVSAVTNLLIHVALSCRH
jgi:UDP-2,4-diacetamido-2,4,6-trideoxy-beta-L-altropyranose hydrolase